MVTVTMLREIDAGVPESRGRLALDMSIRFMFTARLGRAFLCPVEYGLFFRFLHLHYLAGSDLLTDANGNMSARSQPAFQQRNPRI